MKIEERLQTLSKLNANVCFKNKQLYRLLYSQDLYVIAYERLKTNQGAMTSGIHPRSNVDSTSLRKINKIIEELKEESYQPKASRRVYIPKANGKKRPLGIPCWRDKLVQEGIKIILSCIYDGNDNPTFTEHSFGFRPNRGCHTALKHVKWQFKGCFWVIKADVKGFFDNVDHHVLIQFLEKRIEDAKFIRLIWKFLRSGYLVDGVTHKPRKGTPQGGNLSPILANIYLHEFDLFVQNLIKQKGTTMGINPVYNRANTNVRRRRNALLNNKDEKLYEWKKTRLKEALIERNKHKTRSLVNPEKAVIKYARYADDWIIGLKCNHEKAKEIFEECRQFFTDTLNLEWNMSKSILQRSTDKDIEFLGVYLSFTKKRQEKKRYFKLKGKKFLQISIPENALQFKMRADDVFKRLSQRGYVDKNYQPIANRKLVNLDVYEIAKIYQATINGIANYYGFVHNTNALHKIHYWLFLSLGKTLACKFKSTKSQQIKKYGGNTMTFERLGKAKSIEITRSGGYKRDTNNFKANLIKQDNIPFMKFHNWRQSSWLRLDSCCICDSKNQVEMHHVKHIRKFGKKVKGFTTCLRELNRKQIPVCHECHQKIHKGEYDGINLNVLAKELMVKLGIKKWEDRNKVSPQERALMN